MGRILLPTVFAILLVACGPAPGEGDAPGLRPETWRSALFPASWTPDDTDASGRYLPDVSYAGYRNGEAPLPDVDTLPRVDVVRDFGADPTGATDCTAALQAALDAGDDQVVFVPEGLYRVDGLLTVTRPGVVLRGEGPTRSRIAFTRDRDMTGRDHLTFRGTFVTGPELPLVQDASPRSLRVRVADASALTTGMDVQLGWSITDDFVAEHGMTGTWRAFNGTWRVFLRREVRAVDTTTTPHEVLLDAPVRYPAKVRDGASLRVVTGHLEEVGVEALGLASAVSWDGAWSSARSHVLGFHGVKDGWIRDVASFVSPVAPATGPGARAHLQNGGVFVKASKRITIAGCRMAVAQNRGGGGCGYLFEILQSSEVLTRDCVARAGRHNFIQNWGFGTTGCVWLGCTSTDGFAVSLKDLPAIGQVGYSEYHHSLATANLVDRCQVDDGWSAANRHDWSTGAGHTATACVFWNVSGGGRLRSQQHGWGYVIGTSPGLSVETTLAATSAEGTEPEDWREGIGEGARLDPASLYVAQFRARVGRDPAQRR